MNDITFYAPGGSPALAAAVDILRRKGCNVADAPGENVTHLLLSVPSFDSDGSLKEGGRLEDILKELPENVTILGGNLAYPGYKTVDLLQDELYLAENAAITAHCAVKQALSRLPATMQGAHILVIGWGRIGKCLAALLKNMGAHVTVAARKETDRAMLRALGYEAEDTTKLSFSLMRYRVIFNTVPAPVLSGEQVKHCRPDCLKIDLASKPGIGAEDVIWARGLPGKDAPETSGELIARTVLRLARSKEG